MSKMQIYGLAPYRYYIRNPEEGPLKLKMAVLIPPHQPQSWTGLKVITTNLRNHSSGEGKHGRQREQIRSFWHIPGQY